MCGACLCVKLKSVLEYKCVLSQSLSAYCHHSPCLVVPANMAPDYWTHVSKCGRRGSLVLCNVDCPCMYSVHLHLELIFSILFHLILLLLSTLFRLARSMRAHPSHVHSRMVLGLFSSCLPGMFFGICMGCRCTKCKGDTHVRRKVEGWMKSRIICE